MGGRHGRSAVKSCSVRRHGQACPQTQSLCEPDGQMSTENSSFVNAVTGKAVLSSWRAKCTFFIPFTSVLALGQCQVKKKKKSDDYEVYQSHLNNVEGNFYALLSRLVTKFPQSCWNDWFHKGPNCGVPQSPRILVLGCAKKIHAVLLKTIVLMEV